MLPKVKELTDFEMQLALFFYSDLNNPRPSASTAEVQKSVSYEHFYWVDYSNSVSSDFY